MYLKVFSKTSQINKSQIGPWLLFRRSHKETNEDQFNNNLNSNRSTKRKQESKPSKKDSKTIKKPIKTNQNKQLKVKADNQMQIANPEKDENYYFLFVIIKFMQTNTFIFE
jgi:cell division protein FtsN